MSIDLDFDLIIDNLPLLLKGAAVTLEITALSVGIGLLIGMVVGIARLSNFKAIRWLAGIYVDFIRGTPLLVQIFLVYFALPKILGMRIDPFFAAVAACSSIAVPMLPKSSEAASRVLTKDSSKLPVH